jgi:hypothetical protein
MALMVGPARAAGCPIEGPNTVPANQSFTLCAEPASGYSYEWHGQGLATSSTSRCITVSGRTAGTYEYRLIVRRRGTEVGDCSHTVTVGGGGFGTLTCAISGPTSIASGSSANLCAPRSSRHSYRWSGPGGFTANTPCVTVSRSGTYHLTIVNDITGYARECSHPLTVGGVDTDTDTEDCTISGPASIWGGDTAELCSQSYSNSTYSWTGPGTFRSSLRCIRATVPGVYRLSVRNRSTGLVRECSFTLDEGYGDTDDADVVTSDNCPFGSNSAGVPRTGAASTRTTSPSRNYVRSRAASTRTRHTSIGRMTSPVCAPP